MDAFRRLRSRRKSKGQADAFTSFADAESIHNTSSSSPWQTNTTRSSATVSRPSDAEKKFSHDQVRQPVSPLESPRSPGSSTRIQPLLVGISRPSLGSRPNTAGSLKTAVERAANNVVQQPPRSVHSPSSQIGLRAGRYIDIFAISGQTARPTTTFNEDVAERNLDTIALTIEEQHYRYSPASKYQEEVAARNAPHMIASRSPSAQRVLHPSRVADPRYLPLSPDSGSYSRTGRSDADPVRNRQLQDPVAHFSRQNSHRIRDGPDQLPAIPQERSSDDYGYKDAESRARVQQAELEMQSAKARWLQAHASNISGPSPNIDKPLPASPRRKETESAQHTPLRSLAVNLEADLPNSEPAPRFQDGGSRIQSRADDHDLQDSRRYRQDGLRPNGYKPDRRSANTAVTNSSEESRLRSDVSTGRYDRQSFASDQSRRTQQRRPSVTSTNSYRRQIYGNRTIMDLTTEDDAEVTSVASYIQTPVIENARSDAFKKVHPLVVDHHTPPRDSERPNSVVPNARWSSALEPVLDLDQLARRSQMISETARLAAVARSQTRPVEGQRTELPHAEVLRAVTPPPAALAFSPIQTMTGSPPAKVISFSAISTLTSITPRTSQEILAREHIQVPQKDDLAYNQVTRNRIVVPKTDGEVDKLKTTTAVAPIAKVTVLAGVGDPHIKSKTEGPIAARTDSGSQKSASEKTEIAKRNERRREKLARAEAIREAAKQKIPAGPLDQEPMPGVKTRDFAVTPMEKPTNKRIEALSERKRSQTDLRRSSSSDKKSRGRSSKASNKVTFQENPTTAVAVPSEKKAGKKSSKTTSSSTSKSRPKSTFNEEAFQKKHAEANAALLRLQQSLQLSLDEDSSQAETPNGSEIPASRAFTPIDRSIHGKSPVAPSPSAAAAIAMITAATSSPRAQTRPRPVTTASSSSSRSTIKPVPAITTNTDNSLHRLQTSDLGVPDLDHLSPLLTMRLESNKPPPSPGEVSLSSFPIPTPRAMSPESTKSPPAYVKEIGAPVRRGSQASRASTASVFAIPSTMVPSRLGSLPENRNPPPGPPNPHQMQSIDSLIPRADPVSSM